MQCDAESYTPSMYKGLQAHNFTALALAVVVATKVLAGSAQPEGGRRGL
jgi:hypothetical protein